jgi:DNA-directed RNA polymerase subunit RPC12/RpoP
MAKRIIHKGTDTFHAHCGECGCEFTYDRGDITNDYVHGGKRVSCPHCGNSIMHLGEGGTSWPTAPRRPRWSCSVERPGGYRPSGPLPEGSCFGRN